MPAFSPTGFKLLGDATVSSPMDVNTFVGEINPILSYFAGDIATLAIFPSGTDFDSDIEDGYIYPYPIQYIASSGAPALPLTYSKLGVFQYFNYTPADTKIPVQSSCFIKGTQVAPNTKITATVSFSPTATFLAQIKTDTLHPTGVPRGWLYSQMTVGSDLVQTITVTGAGSNSWTLQFPLGSTDLFQGGSRSYLRNNYASDPQTSKATPQDFSSVLFLKMTDIQDSGFSTDTNVIPNPFVECSLTNNSLLQPIGN